MEKHWMQSNTNEFSLFRLSVVAWDVKGILICEHLNEEFCTNLLLFFFSQTIQAFLGVTCYTWVCKLPEV